MRFAIIEAEKAHHPVTALCRLLEVSRSGYYRWSAGEQFPRAVEDASLAKTITEIHEKTHRTYGSPRVYQELRARGFTVARKRVERLMREMGIQARVRRRFKATTDSRHEDPIAPNLVNREFQVEKPNHTWVTDVKAIWTVRDGWIYFAAVLDLFSRRIVGWATSASNDADLVIAATSRAILARRAPEGVIHHSDRGSPYASEKYRALLRQHRMTRSMSRKGDCWDNAVAESFFSTLEWELLAGKRLRDEGQLAIELEDYINFYNHVRRHSTIDYLSPVSFELTCAARTDAAA